MSISTLVMLTYTVLEKVGLILGLKDPSLFFTGFLTHDKIKMLNNCNYLVIGITHHHQEQKTHIQRKEILTFQISHLYPLGLLRQF